MDKEVYRDKVRDILPTEECKKIFDDIVLSRVLGANKHIEMIGNILTIVLNEGKNLKDTLQSLEIVSSFFKETRGNQSRAVYNAINIMTGKLKNNYNSLDEAKKTISSSIKNYEIEAKESLNKVIEYSSNICENLESIMVFDYSSTLNELLKHLKKKMIVYIPESRALDGGFPFLKTSVLACHETHFIADTVMFEALKKCDAAFIGVETLYPDGTIFNTIGSDILAVLCEKIDVPLYAITPMIKVDIRPVYGYTRLSPMPYDFSVRLAKNLEEDIKAKVDFRGIKLLEIKPNYIKAIVTEFGIIPPYAMFDLAMKYSKELEGKLL